MCIRDTIRTDAVPRSIPMSFASEHIMLPLSFSFVFRRKYLSLIHIYIYGSRARGDIFNMLHNGIVVETGNDVADSILGKAGGMNGTMWTINLILLALAYGGALELSLIHISRETQSLRSGRISVPSTMAPMKAAPTSAFPVRVVSTPSR